MIKSGGIRRPQLVLVVDDQEINRDALEVILGEEYGIICAENGQEALEMMREHLDALSIVLLDLRMPVMDGFEVMRRVQADEALRQVPIIVLTAEKTAELKALQMGAADFITKPFDTPEVILARVGRIIELNEGRKLIQAAEFDALTGLYNRNFFTEYVNRIFHFHPELHTDAIVMNIEQFHNVNALHGRAFGDAVLQALGGGVRAFLEETKGIASRYESDRFAICCLHQPDYRALLDRFQSAADAVSPGAHIHLRMGVQPWQEDLEPTLQFDRARAACNLVRGDYQHPLMIYNDEMRARELMNQRLLNGLRSGISKRQFQVYYQPKYDIQCDPPRLASAEALIRWKHPELGMISPAAFVPLFERNGMISDIDNFVWREAAGQVAEWKRKYGFRLPVSVNVSRADLFDPRLQERLVRLVEENGLDYGELKLEVTESAYTDDAKGLLELIRRLRASRFEVEMDDFGSGYSSLNMLSEMPLDVLKMDMKFVRNIEKSETDYQLVKLILGMAKFLKVKVVAEGVESFAQLSLLKEAGCDLVQGYYFSRPLPAEEFEKLIRQEIGTERKKAQ